MKNVLSLFIQQRKGLTFTYEVIQDNHLQFLDINLSIIVTHLYRMYSPRANKHLLPYESRHSKTVKRTIQTMCFWSALLKLCERNVDDSFQEEISRLVAAGFPSVVLSSVSESLLQKPKGCSRQPEAKKTATAHVLHAQSCPQFEESCKQVTF